MGHVFVDFDWDVVCQGFCRRAGLTREEFKPVLRHLHSLGYESGKISTRDFLAELNRVSGADLAEDEFHVLWNATFHENEEMARLLQGLGESRPIFLLSNTNESHYGYLQATYNVARHFSELILSYEVGCSKPEHDIYREVFRRSGHQPEECLFIDDLVPNIEAARELGMNAIRFTGVEPLKSELKLLGIEC